MKKTYIFSAVLWGFAFAASAQVSSTRDPSAYIAEGRVVNRQGIPIKDVLVKSLTTNASVTTGYDGLYAIEIPEIGDSVIFIKEGLVTYKDYLVNKFKIVVSMGPDQSLWMPYNEYAENMRETAMKYYDMGLKFLKGDSRTAPDYKKAYACFFRAANMENGDAAYRLANMYDVGVGVDQDYALAIEWYKKATDVAEAKTRLGVMYSEGTGVEQDFKEAAKYFYQATNLGDKKVAPKLLDELCSKGLANMNEIRVYDIVEKNAEFPGGEEACMKWLRERIKYPQKCIENGIQGRVITQFVVNTDGTIVDVGIANSADFNLAKEAIRLIHSMPKWKPATQGGKTVRQRYNLPITFSLK
jgi:TonB family protein